jgi:hypothetical protein
MKVERREKEVWIIRNKKKGLKLKKIVSSMSFSSCKGCCLNGPNNYMCLRYGRLLTDICNEEKIIFVGANEDSER